MLHLGMVAHLGLVNRINVVEHVIKEDLIVLQHFLEDSSQILRKETDALVAISSECRAHDHENVGMSGNEATLDLARLGTHLTEQHDAIVRQMVTMLGPAINVKQFRLVMNGRLITEKKTEKRTLPATIFDMKLIRRVGS